MLIAIALFLSVPVASDEWSALPLPAVCQPTRIGAHPAALWDGRHVRLSSVVSERDAVSSAPRLPVEVLTQMLSEDARANGGRLEFFRGTPGLLARGDAAALSAARERIAEIERAAANMEVELSLRLVPGRDPKGTDATALVPSTARIASGEEAFFGSRQSQGFIGGYSVQVAANSGVAQPLLGSALSGTTVHVRAARVDGGSRIHVLGVLDMAELVEIVNFDPDTPDFGLLQEPIVRFAQCVFSGVVDNGGTLQVRIAGSPLGEPDWTLTIQAATHADAEPKESGERGWTMIDCAFLAADPPALPGSRPGAGLDFRPGTVERGQLYPGLPPAAIAASLQTAGELPSTARQPLHWSNHLLLVPNSDPALARAARALVLGAEAQRLAGGRIEIRQGKLSADLPVTEGFPARFLAGTERSYLVGYSAEVAPQTWIASPGVEVALDGVCVDVDASSTSALCSYWSAASAAPVDLARKDSQLGKLQLLARTLRADGTRIARDEPARILLPAWAAASARESPIEPLGIAYRAR
jgi:hypothetical protein